MTPPAGHAALERHMAEALALAAQGRFRVEPNPCVGAVVLDRAGAVVGRGRHARFGGPHAEVEALREAGDLARGGTLVVTLEPCAHAAKKTPPCVPLIASAGVARVVAGSPDANPATAGAAARAFAAAGVEYATGVLGAACRAALARYEAHLGSVRPWTVAKWAMTLDGRAADVRGASRWVSSERSRALVHEWRGCCDAVVVGRGTVEADDPSLLPRERGPRRPLRVVLDSDARVRTTARVVATAREDPTLVVCAADADGARRDALAAAGADVVAVPRGADGRVDVARAFEELARRNVRRVLVEAGGVLVGSCFRAGVVDQVAAFVAPLVVGGDGAPTPFAGRGWPLESAVRLESPRVLDLGPDALIEGYVPRSV